jgi:hypothetical protein
MSFYSCHSEGAAGDRRISEARFFTPRRSVQNDMSIQWLLRASSFEFDRGNQDEDVRLCL